MTSYPLSRRITAEALGTAILVATVVGSGIMANRLTDDTALALLGNTLASGAILVVIISILGPISGAHFNPVVSLIFALRREIPAAATTAYVLAQIAGGIVGTLVAHAMFELPLLQVSTMVRTGGGQWLAEIIATACLIFTILGGLRSKPDAVPWLVGLYITAAYWFTASTSFANPAVAIARSLTDTFAGIRPLDLPGFIIAECLGATLSLVLMGWLLCERKRGGARREPQQQLIIGLAAVILIFVVLTFYSALRCQTIWTNTTVCFLSKWILPFTARNQTIICSLQGERLWLKYRAPIPLRKQQQSAKLP